MTDKLNLHALWTKPDNSRLTKTQYSFRLPVHVAAKIQALEECYPTKTRTEIVADLLTSALADLEKSFPTIPGAEWGPHPETGEPVFEDAGPGSEFRRWANKYFESLEKDLGNEKPSPLYSGSYLVSKSES